MAEELNLKGLARGNDDRTDLEDKLNPPENSVTQKLKKRVNTSQTKNIMVSQQHTNAVLLSDNKPVLPADGVMSVSRQELTVDFQELDDKIRSMMVAGENLTTDGKQKAWCVKFVERKLTVL